MKKLFFLALVLLSAVAFADFPGSPIGGVGGGAGSGTVTSVTGDSMIAVANGTTTPALSMNDNSVASAKLLDNTVEHGKIAWSPSFRMFTDYYFSTSGTSRSLRGITPQGDIQFITYRNASMYFNNYDAGLGSGTGTHNVGIGWDTFKSIDSGGYNVGIGGAALGTLTSGSYNIAIGYGAIADAAASVNNTAIGYSTLAGIGPGGVSDNNVAVGSYIFPLGASGSNNTFIGAYILNTATSGSGNVLIGYGAGTGLNSLNNKLIIANSPSDNLIEGDFSAKTVTIAGSLSATALLSTASGCDNTSPYARYDGTCGTGGAGTSDYDSLTSRPTINGVTVTGAVLDNASNYPAGLERTSNKSDNTSLGTSTTLYPTQNAVKVYADTKLSPTGDGSGLTGLTKAQVGLSAVDNTSDANKPVSSATQTALDAKVAGPSSGVAGYLAVLDATGKNASRAPCYISSDNAIVCQQSATLPGQLYLYELSGNGTEFRSFKAPDSLADNVAFLLPSDAPMDNQVLSCNAPVAGISTCSWVAQGAGGMVYPGVGIANSTGSAWGTSYGLDNDATTVSATDNEILSSKATKTALDLKAATNQTMYIGTTAVAINRGSAALVLTGITSIDGSAATATTAGNLSGTPAVPNGTTATTQAANDNSAKLATTAYVDQRYEYDRFVIPDTALGDNTIIAGPLDRAWTIDNIVVVIQDNTGKLSTSASDNVTFNVQYGATEAFSSPTNVYTSNVTATGAAVYSGALNNTAPLTNYYIRVVFAAVNNMTNKKIYFRVKYHRT